MWNFLSEKCIEKSIIYKESGSNKWVDYEKIVQYAEGGRFAIWEISLIDFLFYCSLETSDPCKNLSFPMHEISLYRLPIIEFHLSFIGFFLEFLIFFYTKQLQINWFIWMLMVQKLDLSNFREN